MGKNVQLITKIFYYEQTYKHVFFCKKYINVQVVHLLNKKDVAQRHTNKKVLI